MKLKKGRGRIEVKALGIILTENSTEEEIKRAIKHQPGIAQYIDGAKSKEKE